jgi:hypothetical protein
LSSHQRQSLGTSNNNDIHSVVLKTRPRQSQKPLLLGKGLSVHVAQGMSSIAAAKPFKSVFCVDNVSMSVTEYDLVEFVSSLGVRLISCHEAKPRGSSRLRNRGITPSHRAFRVCINRADSELFLQPDMWPADIVVSRWYFAEKSKDVTNDAVDDSSVVASAASHVLAGDVLTVTEESNQSATEVGDDRVSAVEDPDKTVLITDEMEVASDPRDDLSVSGVTTKPSVEHGGHK